jgi:hypothetical protein
MMARRFPPPWSVDEQAACFIVRDRGGQALDGSPTFKGFGSIDRLPRFAACPDSAVFREPRGGFLWRRYPARPFQAKSF